MSKDFDPAERTYRYSASSFFDAGDNEFETPVPDFFIRTARARKLKSALEPDEVIPLGQIDNEFFNSLIRLFDAHSLDVYPHPPERRPRKKKKNKTLRIYGEFRLVRV